MAVWKDSLGEFVKDLVSRKFLVFATATTLLVFKVIDVNSWVYLSAGFLATNLFEIITTKYYEKKSS